MGKVEGESRSSAVQYGREDIKPNPSLIKIRQKHPFILHIGLCQFKENFIVQTGVADKAYTEMALEMYTMFDM